MTQSSHEAKSLDHSIWEKLTFRIPNTHQYKYPLYPRKTRLNHPQSLHFDSLNSSTLTLSIDIPLQGSLAKSLSHHTHINEEVIW